MLFLSIACEQRNSDSSNSQPSEIDTSVADQVENTGDKYQLRIANMTIEQRKEALENGHKRFLELPVESDHVYQVILPEIREARKTVVPGFPERGGTTEETNARFKNWLNDHPDELSIYLEFLDQKYQEYQKSFQ